VIIHLTHVTVVGPYELELAFSNGVSRRVNLANELYGPVFEPLREPVYFALVSVDPRSGTIIWPNGADFAPDFLYALETTHRVA
jgi:Protein of unknown function (DUF2442)